MTLMWGLLDESMALVVSKLGRISQRVTHWVGVYNWGL